MEILKQEGHCVIKCCSKLVKNKIRLFVLEKGIIKRLVSQLQYLLWMANLWKMDEKEELRLQLWICELKMWEDVSLHLPVGNGERERCTNDRKQSLNDKEVEHRWQGLCPDAKQHHTSGRNSVAGWQEQFRSRQVLPGKPRGCLTSSAASMSSCNRTDQLELRLSRWWMVHCKWGTDKGSTMHRAQSSGWQERKENLHYSLSWMHISILQRS